jgi:hypothetical protein
MDSEKHQDLFLFLLLRRAFPEIITTSTTGAVPVNPG